MTVDALLFWGRIVFLIGLYLFLLFLALSLTRDLGFRSVSEEEQAPGELVIVEPADTGYKLNDAFSLRTETLIGRTPDNTIELADGTVSGHHARLTYRRGVWTVEDFGGRNGTLVNGQKVRRRTQLAYGDVIQFGSVALKLVQ